MKKISWGVSLVVIMMGMFVWMPIPIQAAKKVTITMWATAAPLRTPGREWVWNKFETENPNTKVEFEGVPWGQFMEKILTSVAAGMPPDCMRYGYSSRLAKRGVINPLDDYINGPDGIDKKEYNDICWGPTREWEGKIYSIPYNTEPFVVFYNTDIFEKEGIGIPQTAEELQLLAEKLTVRDSKGNVVRRGYEFNESADSFITWLYNNGGQEVIAKGHHVEELTVDSPEALHVLNWVVDMVKEGYWKYEITGLVAGAAFPTGKTVMRQIQSSQGHDIQPKFYPDFHFDSFQFPPFEGKTQILTGHASDALMIFEGSKHKDLAWKLIKIYGSKEGTSRIWSKGKYGMLPPYKDVWETPVKYPFYEPWHEDPFLYQIAKIANTSKWGPMWTRYWHVLGDEIQMVANEELGKAYRFEKSPEQTLKDIEKRWTKIIAEVQPDFGK